MAETTSNERGPKAPTMTKPIVFRLRKRSVDMVQSLQDLIKDATDVLHSLEGREPHQKFSISFVIDDAKCLSETAHHVGPNGGHSRFHIFCNNGD